MSNLCTRGSGSGDEGEPTEHTKLMSSQRDCDNSSPLMDEDEILNDNESLNRNNNHNRTDGERQGDQDPPPPPEDNPSEVQHDAEVGTGPPQPTAARKRPRFRRPQASTSETPEELTEEEKREILLFGARNVIRLFVPISICMIIVVITMKVDPYYSRKDVFLIYTPFHEKTDDLGTKAWQAIVNAIIVVCVVVVMTCILVCLYKYRCYKFLHGWLILSSLLLLTMFAYMYLSSLLLTLNIPFDFITLVIFMWNFGILGLMVIHWKGPLRVQQAYHLFMSALVALIFIKYLPDWTTWTVLGVLVIWDLVAVLCPRGPLKILVETATERNETFLPALIYSSTMVWPLITMADTDKSNKKSTKSAKRKSSKKRTENPPPNTDDDVNLVTDDGLPLATSIDSTDGRKAVATIGADVYDADGATGGDEMRRGESLRAPNEDEMRQQEREKSDSPDHSTDDVQPIDDRMDRVNERRSERSGTRSERSGTTGERSRERSERSRTTGDRSMERSERSRGERSEGERSERRTQRRRPQEEEDQEEDEEERGVRLGLGDFIFYSMLVGKASNYGDWNTTIACFVAILVGLVFTLLLLAIYQKALPALPISITFGLVFYFATSFFVEPFMDRLNNAQVYI